MREIPPPENGCWPMRGHFPRHFFKTYSKYDIEENPPKLHISVTNKTNNCTYLHVFYRQKVPKSYFTRNTISIATTFITTFTGMFRLDIKLSRLEWPSLQTERKEISLLKRTHWMPIMDTTKIMISLRHTSPLLRDHWTKGTTPNSNVSTVTMVKGLGNHAKKSWHTWFYARSSLRMFYVFVVNQFLHGKSVGGQWQTFFLTQNCETSIIKWNR